MVKICLKDSQAEGELMVTDHELAGKIEVALQTLLPGKVTVSIEEEVEITTAVTAEERERSARQSYFVELMEAGHRPSVAARAAFAGESLDEMIPNYTFDEFGLSH